MDNKYAINQLEKAADYLRDWKMPMALDAIARALDNIEGGDEAAEVIRETMMIPEAQSITEDEVGEIDPRGEFFDLEDR